MFQHQGIWLPDGEKHFPEWMEKHGELVDGLGTYQIKKLRAAMEYCKSFDRAVDVGAHVGLWAMQLAPRFNHVHAFEPVSAYRECFERNLDWRMDVDDGVILHDCALGAEARQVYMEIPAAPGGIDSGGTHVRDDLGDGGNVAMRTLDSFELKNVDFIKIDCEGYELEVLKGARDTLERCKPCVIVEQKPHKLGQNFGLIGTPAVHYLNHMGARLRRELGGDYILSWN